MPNIQMLQEDFYKYSLTMFLRSNPGKTERDFINQEIDKCIKYLPKSDTTPMTDSEFVESVKKIHPNPKNMGNYESWIKSKVRHYKNLSELNTNEAKRIKMDLEIRLGRLPIPTKPTSEKAWFSVGILFATGEMQQLLKKHESPTEVSRVLFGKKSGSYRPYITSSSLQCHEQSGKDKNIYSSYNKMNEIILHCDNKNIPVTQEFINKCELIKPF